MYDEIHLWQYAVFQQILKENKLVENFTEDDWNKIHQLIPTKNIASCKNRWTLLQSLEIKEFSNK